MMKEKTKEVSPLENYEKDELFREEPDQEQVLAEPEQPANQAPA